MRTVVVLLLAATVVGAGVPLVWVEHRRVGTRLVGLGLALGWAVVASGPTVPRFDRVELGPFELEALTFPPALAAAAAAMALLLAARPPRTVPGCVAGIMTVGVFAAAVAGRLRPDTSGIEWPLVAAAGAVVLGAVVVAIADGFRGVDVWVLSAGGVVMMAGQVVDDPEVRAGVTLAGAAIVLLVGVATNRTGVVVAPAILYVAVRVMEDLAAADVGASWSRVGAGVAIAGVVGAVVSRRGERSALAPGSFRGPRVATAGFVAALILVTQDLADLRAAGVLLGAGAALAVASDHRLGLVAFVPGATAAAIAYRVADHPSHAVGATGIIVLALVSSIGIDRWNGRRSVLAPLTIPLAVAFAAIPAWGWTEADVGPHYGEAVAVGVAVGLPVMIVTLGAWIWSQVPQIRPKVGASATGDAGPGSLTRRRVFVTARIADGTTNPHDAQEAEIEAGR